MNNRLRCELGCHCHILVYLECILIPAAEGIGIIFIVWSCWSVSAIYRLGTIRNICLIQDSFVIIHPDHGMHDRLLFLPYAPFIVFFLVQFIAVCDKTVRQLFIEVTAAHSDRQRLAIWFRDRISIRI